MEYRVEASNKKVLKFLESIMPKMIEELGLSNSRRAVFVKVTRDVQEGLEGSTQYFDMADCYIVLIKPPARLTPSSLIHTATTLAHEMVHVRQLAKGILKFLPNERRIWRGKKY